MLAGRNAVSLSSFGGEGQGEDVVVLDIPARWAGGGRCWKRVQDGNREKQRRPSQIRRPKVEARSPNRARPRISDFGLLSAFGFRTSGFGLQRVPHPPALSRFGNRRSPRVPMPRECAGVSRRAALLSKDSLRGAATKGQNKNPSARTRRGVSRGFLRLRGESQVTVCEPRGRTFAPDPASESRN